MQTEPINKPIDYQALLNRDRRERALGVITRLTYWDWVRMETETLERVAEVLEEKGDGDER